MPDSVGYVTKVKEISSVNMHGKVEQRKQNGHERDPDFTEEWHIGKDRLDEWLEKFEGMHVYLEIKTYAFDESHLLPEGERD